ncbi:hypothetical protein NP493_901g00051 [Ridgeia piscesae]|uniref:Uncharacterized protein n=1 Tax=Ridgeia piscesae TaxID=27915 RepID=A0AAD9KKZ3_RIDPI|nr:hypothetical protein NP493_901g00051 [Ridgeia piscesae]
MSRILRATTSVARERQNCSTEDRRIAAESRVRTIHNPSNKTNGNAIAPAAWMSEPPSPETMRAAQVHGQMTSDDFAMRKPQRLESLPPTTKMKRKKSRQQVE